MIEYIKGLVTGRYPTHVVVEAYGIGYRVNISLQTYARIEQKSEVLLLIYTHKTEDAEVLYGFADDAERTLFVQLISVNGVGPNTARLVLSGLGTEETRAAILAEDELTFKRVKGIGEKTAKRIIVDLKDKVSKESPESTVIAASIGNRVRDEAFTALVALGFNKIQVQKVLQQVGKESDSDLTVEALIKLALRQLS